MLFDTNFILHSFCYMWQNAASNSVHSAYILSLSIPAPDGSLCINPLKSITRDGLMINDKDTHGSEEGVA